jgi:hypothetical protein
MKKNVIESKMKKPEERTLSRSQMQNRRGFGCQTREFFFSSSGAEGIGRRVFATDKCCVDFFIHPNEKSCRERRNAG